MRSRALRIAILLFQAMWLNVIVPGHTRGVVALPGEQCSNCQSALALIRAPFCCAARQGVGRETPHRSVPPSRDPAQHCAICHFAARLSLPIAVDLTLPPLAFAGFVPQQRAEHVAHICFRATYDSRGPPHAPSIFA